jgi:hypothetical protein
MTIIYWIPILCYRLAHDVSYRILTTTYKGGTSQIHLLIEFYFYFHINTDTYFKKIKQRGCLPRINAILYPFTLILFNILVFFLWITHISKSHHGISIYKVFHFVWLTVVANFSKRCAKWIYLLKSWKRKEIQVMKLMERGSAHTSHCGQNWNKTILCTYVWKDARILRDKWQILWKTKFAKAGESRTSKYR